MQITVTLHDFTDPENPKEPLHVRMQYAGEADSLEFGGKKITLAVGDFAVCGTISIPLNVLTQLMAQVLEADRRRGGGLVVSPKPNIILPS